MLHRVLYVSRSRLPPGDMTVEIDRLLAAARLSNEAAGISGALLFTGANFVQVLEGTKAQVEALMAKVRNDPRHCDVRIIAEETADVRLFQSWSMAYFGEVGYVQRKVDALLAEEDRALAIKDMLWLMVEFSRPSGTSLPN